MATGKKILERKLKQFQGLDVTNPEITQCLSHVSMLYDTKESLYTIKKTWKDTVEAKRIQDMEKLLNSLRPFKDQLESAAHEIKTLNETSGSLLEEFRAINSKGQIFLEQAKQAKIEKQKSILLEDNSTKDETPLESLLLQSVDASFFKQFKSLETLKNEAHGKLNENFDSEWLKKYEELASLFNKVLEKMFLALHEGKTVLLAQGNSDAFEIFAENFKILSKIQIYRKECEDLLVSMLSKKLKNELLEISSTRSLGDMFPTSKELFSGLQRFYENEKKLLDFLFDCTQDERILEEVFKNNGGEIFHIAQGLKSSDVSDCFKSCFALESSAFFFTTVSDSEAFIVKALMRIRSDFLNMLLEAISMEVNNVIEGNDSPEDFHVHPVISKEFLKLERLLKYREDQIKTMEERCGEDYNSWTEKINMDLVLTRFVSPLMKFMSRVSKKFNNNVSAAIYNINNLSFMQHCLKNFSCSALFIESFVSELNKFSDFLVTFKTNAFVSSSGLASSFDIEKFNETVRTVNFNEFKEVENQRVKQSIKSGFCSNVCKKYAEVCGEMNRDGSNALLYSPEQLKNLLDNM